MLTVSLPLYLLLIANAALIVAAAFAVLRVERVLRESAEFWKSPTGAALKTESGDDPAHQTRLIGLRMAALQRAVDELATRGSTVAKDAVVDLPVEHAVRMAKRGASVDDITRSCGLNIGEAELLHRLHGRPTQNAPPSPDATPIARSA